MARMRRSDHAAALAIEPADHDVLRAAGEQQHAPLVALHQMQPASRVERQHVLHASKPPDAGRRARPPNRARRPASQISAKHGDQRGDGGQDRVAMNMARPFAGRRCRIMPDGAACRQGRDSASIEPDSAIRRGACGGLHPAAGRATWRTAGQPGVEAGEIDRASGFRQFAGETDRLGQLLGERAHRGDRIVCVSASVIAAD